MEDKDRLLCPERMECYEQRMRDLEMRLMERMHQVDEAKECYRSLRQELRQFNVLLDASSKRNANKDGDNNDTKTTNSSVLPAKPTTVNASSSAVKTAPPSAATSKTMNEQQSAAAPPSASPSAQPSKQEQQKLIKSQSSVRISEVDPEGQYIRLINASAEDKDIGGHYIVHRRDDDASATVYQFPLSVLLPVRARVTVWSGASGSNRNRPPTDFVCSVHQKWLTGAVCTTMLCEPNQQVIQWISSNSSTTIHPKEQTVSSHQNDESEKKIEEDFKRVEEGKKEEEKVATKTMSDKLWEVNDNGCPSEEEEESSDQEEEIDCWWGEKKCSLDKTIPGASIHIDDFTAVKKASDQQVSIHTACRGHEVMECASDCDKGRHQKPTTTTKYNTNCKELAAPFTNKKSKAITVPRECSSFVPTSWVSKKTSNGCGSMGLGGGKGRGGCNEGQRKRMKTLTEELRCFSNSSQELRTGNKKRSGNGGDEFFVSPCEIEECEVHGGKGQGWFGSWSSWFNKRCPKEEKTKEDKGGCCEKKKVCCEEKRVIGGCCEEQKVTRRCCEEEKVTQRGCCKETKVTEGCCEEAKIVKKRKMKRSRTCCEEEEEEDCMDPCQLSGRSFYSDCGVGSSRSDPHLASGIGGGRSRRGGVKQGGVDELGCPCACRQSDSFTLTTASLMAAGLTVAAMYCA